MSGKNGIVFPILSEEKVEHKISWSKYVRDGREKQREREETRMKDRWTDEHTNARAPELPKARTREWRHAHPCKRMVSLTISISLYENSPLATFVVFDDVEVLRVNRMASVIDLRRPRPVSWVEGILSRLTKSLNAFHATLVSVTTSVSLTLTLKETEN